MLFVEWYDDEIGKVRLSKMIFWKAIIVHLSGFGKITFKVDYV